MENKKLLALLLSAFTALSLTACGKDKNSSKEEATSSVVTRETGEYDDSFPTSGYTMHDFITSTTSLQWNPLTWETNDDSAVLGYISSSLWDYQINADGDGWEVVSELADGLPTDVTAEYAGQFGVKEGEKRKAYRIKLNPAAQWDNGDPITADDYVYSMQQQLDPEQLNRRADSFYGGELSIHNAQSYLYSGKQSYSSLGSLGYANVAAALADGQTEIYVDCWGFWQAKGYLDGEGGNEVPQYVKITDETKYNDYNPDSKNYLNDEFSGKDLYDGCFAAGAQYESYGADYCYILQSFDETTWDEVGFKKVDNYTLDLILDKPITQPESFYIPYAMGSLPLVHRATFESAWETKADGKRVNNYNLKLEYTRSYGPYMLSSFDDGKRLEFTRNTNWHGYRKGVTNGAEAHKGQFQTSDITWDVISTHSSQLLAFEQGQIDGVGLQAEDLEKYGSSKYLLYTPQSYTTKVSFNTDLALLKAMEAEKADGKNRVIQTVREFREALSYAIDREYFVGAFTSAAAAGFGMLNYMYQVFNEDGTTSAYRDSVPAKKALVDLFGIEYGGSSEYETLDEAYRAITGYDMAKARALLNEAYTKAKEANLYTDGQDIEIQFNVYNSDEIYVNMVNYFDTQLKEAAKGTPFEGHVAFSMYVDDDYYNTMYAGKAQFIYTTWGGATYGTYGVLDNCYTDDHTGNGNQMEIGFDTSKVLVEIEVAGKTQKFSLQAWAAYMNNNDDRGGSAVAAALGGARDDVLSVSDKNNILAKIEFAYLDSFVTIPVYYRQSASLYSKKINYGSKTYIDLIAFGGIRHMTYNYNDTEWQAFIANASNLQY